MITLADIEAEERRRRTNRIDGFFPDHGDLRRELYSAHTEFFAAGAKYRTRVFLAANRVGKTIAGSYESACHLTGEYPKWWVGKRFKTPIKAWAVGLTGKTTRDSIQTEMLGEPSSPGTGMIRASLLRDTTPKAGVPRAVDSAYVEHISGGVSKIVFKSSDQGREAFQAESVQVIWIDEEADESVYEECLIRTATVGGIVTLTFTPLLGVTPLVQKFLPQGEE